VSDSKYYLVILDDFTHYVWTFPLKLKYDTFTTLSNFFAYVSTQFGRTVKAIQCDNGREFDNSSTRIFLLSNGTQLRMSCPYTSPQNGKVERIIRLVKNAIHTLMIQSSLPGRYWAEGLRTTTYLLNRLPTTAIQVVCPHLALFGSAPSYEHLHVFGCTCYPNMTATAPHKLSPRSIRCVFLGYSADHKGYRCLDLSTNCLIVSRHVVFDEDIFPLAASSSLTELDFLGETAPTVSTIGTHLTTAGTSTPAPRRPAPEIPLGFEPHVAPLPAPAVPPRFLPRAATRHAQPLRHLQLRHAQPRLRHLSSQAACHPVHGRPHRLPTSDALDSPRRRVPLHRPLFHALLWTVRAWWCMSRPQRIHIG
jgi:hypothetical protein